MDLIPFFEGLSSFQAHTSNNCCLANWPRANTSVTWTPVFPSSSSAGAFLSDSEWGEKCGNKRGYIYNFPPFGIHNLESSSGMLCCPVVGYSPSLNSWQCEVPVGSLASAESMWEDWERGNSAAGFPPLFMLSSLLLFIRVWNAFWERASPGTNQIGKQIFSHLCDSFCVITFHQRFFESHFLFVMPSISVW